MTARAPGPPAPAVVSVAVRRTTVAAVLAVAGVAAVVSYAHMQQVASRAGEAWRAWLLPLSVDGLMVAASMVLLARHRAGSPGGVLAWAALLAGVGASLAANVAAAEPTGTARMVAAWPAVAFAVAFELLLAQHRPEVRGQEHKVDRDPERPMEAPTVDGGTAPSTDSPSPASASHRMNDNNSLARRAVEVLAAADGPVGRRVLARELGCSEHRARVLLDALAPNGSDPTEGDHRG